MPVAIAATRIGNAIHGLNRRLTAGVVTVVELRLNCAPAGEETPERCVEPEALNEGTEADLPESISRLSRIKSARSSPAV